MGFRLLFVVAIVLGLAPVSASAEGIFHRASCSVVRYYVAKYSASMAEAWARSKGATDAEIESAAQLILRAKYPIALTGAGMSVEAVLVDVPIGVVETRGDAVERGLCRRLLPAPRPRSARRQQAGDDGEVQRGMQTGLERRRNERREEPATGQRGLLGMGQRGQHVRA